MHVNRINSSRKIKYDGEGTVRLYSKDVEFLRGVAVGELRRRGYTHVVVEKPVEREDGSLIYVKVYAEGGDGLPNVAVECFTEVPGRVSRRAKELREALPDHSIILVFPEKLAPNAASYADCGDEIWLVSPDGKVECYAGGDAEGLKTHLRNKILRLALQAREEIKEFLRDYEVTRNNLKIFSKGIVYTQAPLRGLFALSAKLVLGDKLYPELADINFLGPYYENAIERVKYLRELKGKISEKIVEVANEILKIETNYGIEKRGESGGEPLYYIKEVREDYSIREKPLVPRLEYFAVRYLTEGLEDVKKCLELQNIWYPEDKIHSYIMDEVIEEIKKKAEKNKKAKKNKQQAADKPAANSQGEYIAVPRKVLEEMLEKIEKIEESLKKLREAI